MFGLQTLNHKLFRVLKAAHICRISDFGLYERHAQLLNVCTHAHTCTHTSTHIRTHTTGETTGLGRRKEQLLSKVVLQEKENILAYCSVTRTWL